MKILFSILFAIVIWTALYKVFFDDVDDFCETARENSFWFAIGLILDTHFGGIRFLIFAAVGISCGALLYSLL